MFFEVRDIPFPNESDDALGRLYSKMVLFLLGLLFSPGVHLIGLVTIEDQKVACIVRCLLRLSTRYLFITQTSSPEMKALADLRH